MPCPVSESDSAMSLVPTRLLVINNQVKFSAGLKNALEQAGGFEVATFTSPEAALEYARNRALSAVMVDFRLKDGSSPVELILKLRALQPDVAVIVSPISSETEAARRDFDLQAVIDIPISARQLIPILRGAVAQALDALPDTVAAPPAQPGMDSTSVRLPPRPGFTSLDAVLGSSEPPIDGTNTIPVDMSDAPAPTPPASPIISDDDAHDVFRLLAEEEPPLPFIEENGTIRDLIASLQSSESFDVQQMIEILSNSVDQPADPDPDAAAPPAADEPADQHPIADPVPNLAKRILTSADDPAEPLDALRATADAVILPDDFELMSDDEREDVLSRSSLLPVSDPAVPPTPEVARLALQLTQASLELTAEASVLQDASGIIASAGLLPEEDIDDLRRILGDDWQTTPGGARIRYATLPSSGKEYLLYSRQTAAGYTLTVIFSGKTPLRVIRRQSERLLDALNDAPAIISEVESAGGIRHGDQPAYTGTRHPCAFLWVLRVGHPPLEMPVRQAIVAGMDIRLTKESWLIHTLDAQADYIYLYADVPGERPHYEVIAELKRLSAQIASARNPALRADQLWSDAYMALLPGRELTDEEIQRFLAFGR